MSQGLKYDQGKPRWSLMPFNALREVLGVLEYGARKYKPNNWLLVENPTGRYSDALMRHVCAYMGGEDVDPESGLHHLAHAVCNALFLLHFESDRQRDDEGIEAGSHEHR